MRLHAAVCSILTGAQTNIPPTQSHTQHTTHSENTPGPTTADPYRGTGRQLLSTRHSSPGWGFGTGRRLPDYINDSPGVGSYYA